MNPMLEAAFRRHHLITRAAARAAGLTPQAIDRLVRDGDWVAVRRGVYAERAYVATLATRAERQRLRDDAACLTTRVRHVRSHDSAAIVWGLPILLPKVSWTHLTVPVPPDAPPAPQRTRRRHGVKHHRAPYGPADLPTVVDGIGVLGRARTALDIARDRGLLLGVVTVDAALHAGSGPAEFTAVLDRMRNWPHVTIARQAVDLADAGAESWGETLARLLVESLGRGRPETQFGLSREGRTAFVDLRLGRHLIEFDGQVKYRRREAGGLADRPAEDVVWEEKKRQDWLCGFKLGMSRLTVADVLGPGREAAAARLERELADTDARFGTSIEDLSPYVVRRRARRTA
ncbi:type IV toxin-antitoxin system AbiEi family antitoxin domain-containing protein [Nocardioides pantholopis]|uniref:type IV toxin-antitoxin system AbiEi family antitoxin domain-containing protein n=1 Tax=Nocardioides pantholopis TaxID=2483798 RepID=UPI000FD95A32|nr:type IV toxin-antitoxin system AbiEi family antitoxin domain-containing protein [Nocardioides pantholopis]